MHELGIADKISQADFDAIADALDSGMSARAAVRNADTGIPHSTVRRWLLRAGVGLPTNYSWSSLSAMSAMSAHQIRTAMTAHADYVRRQGKTMGSAKAAYMALGARRGQASVFRPSGTISTTGACQPTDGAN